jgi:exonuclease VII small subunit
LGCRQELEAAQQQIAELFERMRGIQHKSEESERLVQDICR